MSARVRELFDAWQAHRRSAEDLRAIELVEAGADMARLRVFGFGHGAEITGAEITVSDPLGQEGRIPTPLCSTDDSAADFVERINERIDRECARDFGRVLTLLCESTASKRQHTNTSDSGSSGGKRGRSSA